MTDIRKYPITEHYRKFINEYAPQSSEHPEDYSVLIGEGTNYHSFL